MNYPDLYCLPSSRIEGIGGEPNEAYKASQPVKICSHKGKRDEHTSFPKGLLPIENIKD